MSALKELAAGYREAAIRLRLGIDEAKERLKTADEAECAAIQRDIALMRQMLREARELRQLCEGYYSQTRTGAYTTSTLRAARRNSLK